MSNSFATPWTVAYRLLCPWDFPGKNTGVGCHFLLQGILPTQGNCLVAELVKNLPAVQEPQVHSLGWEDPILCKLGAIKKKIMLQSYNDIIKCKVSQVFVIPEKNTL